MATSPEYDRTLTPELKAVRGIVRKAFEQANPVHTAYEKFWREAYSLHRNHKELQTLVTGANDRDAARVEAASAWGADLAIPLVFSAIETIVPRLLSNPPTFTVRPRSEAAIPAVKPIKELLEQQQRDIGYELKLQPTIRRALKYGLGVQKTYWEKRVKTRLATSGENRGQPIEVPVFEGPQAESVEIFDFYWDPAATSMDDARWVIHRTWRDMAYIKKRIEDGKWFTGADGLPVPEGKERDALIEAISKSALGPESAAAAFWLRDLSPASTSPIDSRAGREHEVLEYHNGEWVYTIIDKCFVAVADKSPYYHRDMPFQIYRPTMQEGEFVGISEIEPAKHLQLELNALRSQRRDNARFVLDRVYAYTDGLIDPKYLRRGPGTAIPVAGDPQDALYPIPVEDLPSSSYREEQALKEDFDRATGIDDSVAGSGAAGDTATGTQLVQQAATVRITFKGKNLINEMARPAARQFLELNKQFMRKKITVRIDDPQTPEGYRFEEIDPATLMADVDLEPDAGSTEPENTVQKRNDALTVYNQLNGNENVDQRHLVRYLLAQHDIADADSFLSEQGAPDVGEVVQLVGDALRQRGVDDAAVMQFLEPIVQQLAPGGEQPAPGQEQPATETPAPA